MRDSPRNASGWSSMACRQPGRESGQIRSDFGALLPVAQPVTGPRWIPPPMLSRWPCGCLLRVELRCPTRNNLTPPNRSETRGENGGGFARSVRSWIVRREWSRCFGMRGSSSGGDVDGALVGDLWPPWRRRLRTSAARWSNHLGVRWAGSPRRSSGDDRPAPDLGVQAGRSRCFRYP